MEFDNAKERETGVENGSKGSGNERRLWSEKRGSGVQNERSMALDSAKERETGVEKRSKGNRNERRSGVKGEERRVEGEANGIG